MLLSLIYCEGFHTLSLFLCLLLSLFLSGWSLQQHFFVKIDTEELKVCHIRNLLLYFMSVCPVYDICVMSSNFILFNLLYLSRIMSCTSSEGQYSIRLCQFISPFIMVHHGRPKYIVYYVLFPLSLWLKIPLSKNYQTDSDTPTLYPMHFLSLLLCNLLQ